MKVTVNKCPHTGKLFESDAKYKSHMAARNRANRRAAQVATDRKQFADWLHNEKLSITHTDMVMPWVLENQRCLMDAANKRLTTRTTRDTKFYPTDEIKTLQFEYLKYNKIMSNSNSCPAAGTTNRGGKDNTLPKGYPGWYIRFVGSAFREQKHNYEYPFSNLLNAIGISTGSGGGSNKSFGYDGQIWLSDWPGLQVQVVEAEMDTIANKLKGVK